MTRKKYLLSGCACVAAIAFVSAAQTARAAIQAGDIAVIGFNSDDPDEVAFVALNTIPAGEVIRFTDSGWMSGGGFRATEGGVQFTVATDLAPGTVVDQTAPFTSGNWSTNGAGVGTSGFALAVAGDQILAFQGDAAAPAFVYGLNVRSNWGNATNSNTSALPTGLVDGTTAVAITGNDDCYYNGPTSGTQAELLAAIGTPANWTKSNTRLVFPAWSFTVSGGGAPTGACTLPSSQCVRITEAACTTQGGSYQGDGTNCPAAIGACCEGQVCSNGITEPECLGVGGSFKGADSICGQSTCQPGAGACCLSDSTCLDGTLVQDCCSMNGTFRGANKPCSQTNCTTWTTLDAAHDAPSAQSIAIRNAIVVTVDDLVSSATTKSFTIQDLSGTGGETRGYTVFGTNADIDAILGQVSAGSLLSISGQATTFNGLSQLAAPFTAVQVCGSTTVPSPVTITIADLQEGATRAEDLESVVVTLPCVSFNDAGGTFAGLTDYSVTDPATQLVATVRVQTAALDLVGQTIPSGLVTVTGVVSQFDTSDPRTGNYELLPIHFADIVPCAATGACCTGGGGGGPGCPTCAGDMNGSGGIDLSDVPDFVHALLGQPIGNPSALGCANVNGDAAADGLDVSAFVDLVLAHATCGSCQQTSFESCNASGGTFHAGVACEANPCN